MQEHDFAKLIAEHRRFPATLRDVVAYYDDDFLRGRETPERWSPMEILRHVLDEEREDFRVRLRFILGGGGEDPGPLDPASWVIPRRYNEAEARPTLAEFAAERRKSCRQLEAIDPANFGRAFRVTDDFVLRAGDVIAAWRIHDLLHLKQITAAIATLRARSLRPWIVEYAGEIPYLDAASPSDSNRRSQREIR